MANKRRSTRRTNRRPAVRSARRSVARRSSPRRSARRSVARRSARRSSPRRSVARRSAPRRTVARRSARRTARRTVSPFLSKRVARKSSKRSSRRRMTPPPIPPNRRGKAIKSDVDSFLAGIDSAPESGPYGLEHVFKEDEKGYKGQRVNKKDPFKERKQKKRSKKGASPYNKFVAKHSPIIRAKNPGKSQPEIMKLIAKAWAEEKKK